MLCNQCNCQERRNDLKQSSLPSFMNTAWMPVTHSPLAFFYINRVSWLLSPWEMEAQSALPHEPSLKLGQSSLCYLFRPHLGRGGEEHKTKNLA